MKNIINYARNFKEQGYKPAKIINLLPCIIIFLSLSGCVREDDPDIKEWQYYSTINKNNSDVIMNINWEKKKFGEMFPVVINALHSICLFKNMKIEAGKHKLDDAINTTVLLLRQTDKVISFVKEDENLVKTYKEVELKSKELHDLCNDIANCLKEYERDGSKQGFIKFCQKLDDLYQKIDNVGKSVTLLYKNVEVRK